MRSKQIWDVALLGIIATNLALLSACGKKDQDASESEDDESEVGGIFSGGAGGRPVGTSEANYALYGTLSGFALKDAAAHKIRAYRAEGGVVSESSAEAPVEVAVNANGDFVAPLDKSGTPAELAKYMNADGSINRELLKADNPEHAAEIDGMTDEQLITELSKSDGGGGPKDVSWVLALMDDSASNKMDSIIAFINLPGDAGGLYGQRPQDMTSDLSLGRVDENGKAETTLANATTSISKVPGPVLQEIAKTNAAIRSSKNIIANSRKDASGKSVSWDFTPFFTFSGEADDAKNASAAPSAVTYENTGVYVSTDDVEKINFDQACAAAGSADFKKLSIVPPSDVVFGGVTFNAANPISNEGSSGITTTGSDTRECGNSNGSAHGGFFGRQFTGDKGNGVEWLFNTTIDSKPPQGIWQIKAGDDVIARFDIGIAEPIDANGKPIVYVPSPKVTVNGSGVIEKIEVDWYVYNAATSSYDKLTDLTAFNKIAYSVSYGMDDYDGHSGNGNGRKELYNQFETPSSGATHSAVASDFDGTWLFSGASSTTEFVAGSINISYDMYGNRYRFDYR